jgi:hypothetical protein
MRCLYDNAFMPLRVFIDDLFNTEYKKKYKDNLKKCFNDLKFCYQHYIHGMLLENILMPFKIVAAAGIALSAVNFFDDVNQLYLIPDYINVTRDLVISLKPKMMPLYFGSLIGLNAFHVLQSGEKDKGKRLLTTVGYPFYKLGLLYSEARGFLKGLDEYIESHGKEKSHNRFEQLSFAHTIYKPEFMNADSEKELYHRPLETRSAEDLGSLIKSLNIPKKIKTKITDYLKREDKELFRNVIYKTIYHDFLFTETDPRYREAMGIQLEKDQEIDSEKKENRNLMGIVDLVDLELAMYSLEDTTQLLGYHLKKENIKTPTKISAIQEGYVIPTGKNTIAILAQSRVPIKGDGPSEVSLTLYEKSQGTYVPRRNLVLEKGICDGIPMDRKYAKLEIETEKIDNDHLKYTWKLNEEVTYETTGQIMRRPILPYSNIMG